MRYISLLCLLFCYGHLFSGEIFNSFYSSAELDKFWNLFNKEESGLDKTYQSLSEMENFYIDKNGTPSYACESDDRYCFNDDSFDQNQKLYINEENALFDGIDLNAKIYTTHPLSSERESSFRRRLAYLEIYLTREKLYMGADSSEWLKVKEQRKNSANLEMFLIYLRNYFSFSDIVQKCEQITSADSINSTFIELNGKSILNDNNILNKHLRHLELYNSLMTSKGFKEKLKQKSICNVSAKKDYQTIKTKITARIHEKIKDYIREKADEYNALFSEPSAEINRLVNQIDDKKKDLKIVEIFKLEESLNNVSANVSLLVGDDLNLMRDPKASLLIKLRNAKEELKNKGTKNKLTQSAEITESLELINKLVSKQNEVMEQIKQIGERFKIDSCKDLERLQVCIKEIQIKINDVQDKSEKAFRAQFSNAMLELTKFMGVSSVK